MRIDLPNGFKMRPYQKRYAAYLDNGGKRAVGVWHRRAGKDLVALHQSVKMAHERKGVYWHALPSYRQAKKAIWDGFTQDGQKILDTAIPPALIRRKHEGELLVELKCGSIIQLVGSDNIDSLIGTGPIHVTFSEYAVSKQSAWELVRPILRENGGTASFISTPRGNNHLKTLFDVAKKTPGWFCELLSIHDTGIYPDPHALIAEELALGMPEPLVRSEYLCDWTAALVGSVWGDLIEAQEKRGNVCNFEHARDEIFTTWDLGVSDATSILFWRVSENGVDFVDHYSAHGQPLSHYFDVLEQKEQLLQYRYVKHWLPHDARARTLQTGMSVLDQFVDRFGSGTVAITPQLSLIDGIQAGRWLLQQNVRFHAGRCSGALESLRQYHYAYDEDRKIFTNKPDHDWSSHDADAFRYAAVVAKTSQRIVRARDEALDPVQKARKRAEAAIARMQRPQTIGELFGDLSQPNLDGGPPKSRRI